MAIEWMKTSAIVTALLLLPAAVSAKACDYRPTKIFRSDGGGSVTARAADAGVSGAVEGFYTLVNVSSGATMLGAGATAASGVAAAATSGAAAASAIALNPFVWVPALVAGVGGGTFEAVCAYMVDERITDYDEVMTLMRGFEASADPAYFELVDGVLSPFIRIRDMDNSWVSYNVEDLYVVEGILMHRKFGRNTKIGRVVLVEVEEQPDAPPAPPGQDAVVDAPVEQAPSDRPPG
ncbi:hypothetical protein [Pseudooceanicola algae]|uniref:Uncharacterized protein n=1 Tax=Pseudooceanicola algae TaxID=1537215 RepID=A0A418SIG0_9RHOB|nr:hypothetical protein [Pseudooceanicola algae]QPM92117.1 hypothetical protein PSAL_033800 [Pseudooceanicola algae]